MKLIVPFIVLSFFCPAQSRAESRSFSDTTGRKIQAELLAVRGDQVEMRINGKPYTIPIERFSEEDVTYIKEWGEANPAPINVRGFYIEIKKHMDKLDEPEADPDNKKKNQKKTSRTAFEYSIQLKNTSTQDLEDLNLKYTVYKYVSERSTESGKSESLEEVTGEESIAVLESVSDVSFETPEVVTVDSEEEDKKAGTKTSHRETIWGVVAEVYMGNSLIRSGSYPDGLERRVSSYKANNP